MFAIVKILRTKRWTAVIAIIMTLLLAGLVALCIRFYESFDTSYDIPMFIDGEYSVDGGDWKPISNKNDTTDRFSDNIVFKGKLTEATEFFNTIGISSKNVWYTVKNSKGETVFEYNYYSPEQMRENVLKAFEGMNEENLAIDVDEILENYHKKNLFSERMPNTPGYYVQEYDLRYPSSGTIDPNEVITLEVVNPYGRDISNFSECFDVVVSESNGEYTRFIFQSLPWVFLYILVCFFGIFFFPIAGFILGKVDFKYLTFGALCFFWGLFMIAQNISGYLNLWITDPTVCLLIFTVTNYLFVLSMLVYMKANLGRSITRAIANGVNSVYLLLIIAVIVLHLTNVADVHVTFPNMMLATAVCGIILPILLLIETRTNPQALYVLVSWIPIALAIIVDTIDHYHPFTHIDFYIISLGFTMIYQIIRLVFDLKRQYKETIRYQKMQKELYEAKVSVMVSQIQPHFMYNALSSIAMLCKLDPDTAYNATITFSDYLRCKMDSLKQQTPVPFEKELEHLKKYLYIEQLRFGKKLNIVYDIKTTDFVLPQLSIQPLVENAVKHGVGMKKKGGTVTIATNETDEYYEVIISDDGVGFDTEQKKDDGRSHVGMENTRKRLKDMCGADVIITSVVGEGTVATVMLPKEEQNNENTVR